MIEPEMWPINCGECALGETEIQAAVTYDELTYSQQIREVAKGIHSLVTSPDPPDIDSKLAQILFHGLLNQLEHVAGQLESEDAEAV